MTTPLETREDAYRDVIRAGRIKMILILLVCAAPIIASYVTYYFVMPQGRVNYGELVMPVKPVPPAQLHTLDGRPYDFAALKGKWVMLTVDGGACPEACVEKLYKMRQVRAVQGKDADRIELAWLIDDEAQLETRVIRAYDATHMLRAAGTPLLAALPPASGGALRDHIYLIDPLGNLVLRFPKDAVPEKMKKDLERLLKYSGIG
ncbi:MAG TPA: cytochrome C oxidase subunit I [Burkholderiales bacterium]|jgi:cytochrome oxidase Cu insertion factor (SCO1/SenC/PrrC family)|nr:cytochrome C oxidase subunit I [Burkholderiales bacterium]